MNQNNFPQKVEEIKEKIQKMIEFESSHLRSNRWDLNTRVMNYVHYLPQEELKLIRLHTRGISYDIYRHIACLNDAAVLLEKDSSFIEPYQFYTKDIPKEFHIGEPQLPPETGLMFPSIHGKILTEDVVRCQILISNTYRMKIFDTLPNSPLVLEIGGGYGALAHHLHSCLEKIGKKPTYIILDLPNTLFFSSIFLTLNNPTKKIYLYDKESFTKEFLSQKIFDYDYVLLPHYIIQDLEDSILSLNLIINSWSFGEMLVEQVVQYLQFAKRKLNGFLISDNTDYFSSEKGIQESDKKPGAMTKLFERYFQIFPPAKFYKKYFFLYIFYRSATNTYLHFIIQKGKEYPANNFELRLRSSSDRTQGKNLSFFFQKKNGQIQTKTRIQRKLKPYLKG